MAQTTLLMPIKCTFEESRPELFRVESRVHELWFFFLAAGYAPTSLTQVLRVNSKMLKTASVVNGL